MIPILFEIGPLKIYSFGLLLGIGFLVGSYILSLELKRKGINPEVASTITIRFPCISHPWIEIGLRQARQLYNILGELPPNVVG
jgi:prolipoprotein diacylglyceryltransferase